MNAPGFTSLSLYSQSSTHPPLEWQWVDRQLRDAGTYWIVLSGSAGSVPHPRPVWGIWQNNRLALSVGSPIVVALARSGVPVAVHLDSGTEVVVVQGTISGSTSDEALIDAYNTKYDWVYDLDQFGPLTCIDPVDVIAWRSAGWAGREGFQETGKWRFDSPSD
ncbi:MAG: hypothetical protein ABIR32_17170 [Ilumatobacteraceae bacterium]